MYRVRPEELVESQSLGTDEIGGVCCVARGPHPRGSHDKLTCVSVGFDAYARRRRGASLTVLCRQSIDLSCGVACTGSICRSCPIADGAPDSEGLLFACILPGPHHRVHSVGRPCVRRYWRPCIACQDQSLCRCVSQKYFLVPGGATPRVLGRQLPLPPPPPPQGPSANS